jgi:hypothetical protein
MSDKSFLILLAYGALTFGCEAAPGQGEVVYPEQVFKCLAKPVASDLDVMTDFPPYYLRGDFDGDGKPDYAVAVRGRKTKRRGVLICDAQGRVFVLGADNPIEPPFSDVERDNFVAPNWVVYSRSETMSLGRLAGGVPYPLPRILGETIGMIWENGTALIYWDGHRYRWAGFK